jgi:hypothetical protein
MKIFIEIPGQQSTCSIDVVFGNGLTVSSIKDMICKKYGIPVAQQQLIFRSSGTSPKIPIDNTVVEKALNSKSRPIELKLINPQSNHDNDQSQDDDKQAGPASPRNR